MVIFRTATADFGDSQTSLALRVAQDKYIAPNCLTNLGKMEAEDPFAHNYLFSGHSKEEVLEAIVELIHLHKYDGLELKAPSHSLGSDYNYLGVQEDPNSNAPGLTYKENERSLVNW